MRIFAFYSLGLARIMLSARKRVADLGLFSLLNVCFFLFAGNGEIDFQEFLNLMTNTERFLEGLGEWKIIVTICPLLEWAIFTMAFLC